MIFKERGFSYKKHIDELSTYYPLINEFKSKRIRFKMAPRIMYWKDVDSDNYDIYFKEKDNGFKHLILIKMKKLITMANLTFTKKNCNCGLKSKTTKPKKNKNIESKLILEEEPLILEQVHEEKIFKKEETQVSPAARKMADEILEFIYHELPDTDPRFQRFWELLYDACKKHLGIHPIPEKYPPMLDYEARIFETVIMTYGILFSLGKLLLLEWSEGMWSVGVTIISFIILRIFLKKTRIFA